MANCNELEAWSKKALICGIDEVGRGPLAGPLTLCAVILHPQSEHPLLKDSKTLSLNQRLKVFEWLQFRSVWQVVHMSAACVDRVGINAATHMAVERLGLLMQLKLSAAQASGEIFNWPLHSLVIDFMRIDKLKFWQSIEPKFLIKGETASISIAAASIIAKVIRDELMQRYALGYSQYFLQDNKGYGTAKHLQGLKNQGIAPIHRQSYAPISGMINKSFN